jgi:hypothetical protein
VVATAAAGKFNAMATFLDGDMRREIWIAEEERQTQKKVTPFGGAGNLLLALGLLCYTEAFGAYLSGFRGRGWSAVNFHWGFRKLGTDYRALMDTGEQLDVYDRYRCGYVHEVVAAGSLTAMTFDPTAAHLCAVGRDLDTQQLYFVVDKYFADLQSFVQRLADHPSLGEPRAATRPPTAAEKDAARYSDENTGLA